MDRGDFELFYQWMIMPLLDEMQKQTALLEQLVNAQMPVDLISSDDLDVPAFLNRIKNHPSLSVVDNPEGESDDTEDADTL